MRRDKMWKECPQRQTLFQAKELLNQLNDTLAHLPVEVVLGKSFVRVRHQVRIFPDSEIIALQTCEDFFLQT